MNDILFDSDDEVLITNGDFTIGKSHQQHQKHLLLFEKGTIKENPVACVGAATYLEAEDEGELLREINTQFAGDGMIVASVEVKGSIINVNADYK